LTAGPLRLEVLDSHGRRVVLVENVPFTIGRSSENQLQLTDAQVSRHHAQVMRAGEEWRVRDCGSRFGTFLNDTKIEEAPIRPGDRIRIGQTELRVDDDHSSTVGSSAFDFRQMSALLAGLRALGSSNVLEEVLALVLDSALDLSGAERGFILLANPEGKLELRAARTRGRITLTTAQTSRRIPEEVFATGNDKIVMDLLEDNYAPMHTGTVALGIRHVLCTPLNVVQYGGVAADRRIGVLYLDSQERGYLQHAGALHMLAAEAAIVIENARLYREVVVKERAEQELRVAAQIQQALLPPPYLICPVAELAANTVPCREVGGDFFDYATLPDGGLMFAVGDVAGKGTSAALLNAVVQGLFAAEVDTSDDPAVVLGRVNRALCRRAIESRFVTGFYGQVSPGRRLRYCNAGHNPPFLLTDRGAERLEIGGSVLGLFDRLSLEYAEVAVAPGDLLVLFSDGVTEAENEAGEELGDDRLAACLYGVRARSATEVMETVIREVRAFCGSAPARDDVTIMVVKFR
jgi:serine phosphatase RsbU (regulator of sigma subunit)